MDTDFVPGVVFGFVIAAVLILAMCAAIGDPPLRFQVEQMQLRIELQELEKKLDMEPRLF